MYKDIEIYPIIKASSYSLSKRTSAYRFPPPSLALLAVNPHPQPSPTTPSLAPLAVTSKSEGQKQLDDIMAKACDEIVINH